jgi:hypothetical protein
MCFLFFSELRTVVKNSFLLESALSTASELRTILVLSASAVNRVMPILLASICNKVLKPIELIVCDPLYLDYLITAVE